MTQDMISKKVIEENIFPRWEQNIPTLGTKHSSTSEAAKPSAHTGNKTCLRLTLDEITARASRDYGSCLTRLRLVVMLLMMITLGNTLAWGQSEGVYYIANNYQYNSGNSAVNWYLVPADNPQKAHKSDAFFNDQFCNVTGKGDYTGDNYGDPEKAFLTTYKTNKDAASVPTGVTVRQNNSVWILKAVSGEAGMFYIIHATTGKYVVYEPPYKDATNRKSVHLLATDNPGENAKFEVTVSSSQYNIRPKSLTGWYFNPAGTQVNQYYANNGDYNHLGMVGVTNSSTGNSIWYLETTLLTAPTISDVSASNTITITDVNELPTGYTIRYTTGDGTQAAPTATTGTVYDGPISVEDNWTVKAVVVRYGIVLTNVATKDVSPVIAAPTVTNNGDGTITLSTVTSGATIYYTTDGTTPDNTSTSYSSAFSLGNATVIKAIAYLGSEFSEVTTYNVPKYTTPTISFNSSTSQVTITSDGTVYYNTGDGSQADPNASSTAYSAPFSISSATTVKAIATHAGYLTSEVATLPITQVATPTIQDNGSNAVSITCATEGATIYYTTDGSTPTTSSTEYTGPLTENVSGVTIKAIAVKENMITSAVGSGSVTLTCATPTIAQIGKTVSISCSSPTNATIRYTLDGTNPGSSSTAYSGTPIDISSATLPVTIKAYASATGYTTSEINSLTITSFGNGTAEAPYIIGPDDFASFISGVNGDAEKAAAYYQIQGDINASGCAEITRAFTGSLEGTAKADGTFYKISNLSHALFNTIDGGTVKNIILDNVKISNGTNVGAICNEATGASRIYNCGVLPTTILREDPDDEEKITGFSGSSISGSGAVGSIVGLLSGTSRVINCFSYANLSGGSSMGGIVGNNSQTSTMVDIKTIVVNCMFYGEITGSGFPVYGGNVIENSGTTAINNYNYYRGSAKFDDGYSGVASYNRSWPAEEQHLTHFEYYRSILNSNRKLCTWWVNGTNETAPTDADVNSVGIAKWVLDPSIAPYPILKKWGKYPSIINPDEEQVWDPRTKDSDGTPLTPHWVTRSTAPEFHGKSHGKLTITVKTGSYPGTLSGLSEREETWKPVITEMDTLNYDYGYYKVQLPYYNEVFGDPEETDYLKRYWGNYTNKVVTAWKITYVNKTGKNSFVKNWENGYNYADRNCTAKDIYDDNDGRAFAQGGYYYVPEGVTAITIEAYWGDAFYLHGKGHALDRVSVCSTKNYGNAFTPAGTLDTKLKIDNNASHDISIYDDFATLMAAVKAKTGNVYEQAIVLVGNYPLHAQNDIDLGNSGNGGFTIMSADFDFDNEPDFCLPLQWRSSYERRPIMPARFDFLPVPELGLTMRHDNYAYAIGVFVPQGHFEITETSFMHTTQFEYMSSYSKVNINHQQPLIFNGGQFEQIVCHSENGVSTLDYVRNIILGGHVWMKRFTPGSHTEKHTITRHCAVSVMGGEFPEFYLTGLYWTGVGTDYDPYNDNPHCYTNGGRFGIMAGAGMEAVKNSVYFEIDHSIIDEFYGGGINANNPVAGNINVTINNSVVNDIYCGGPKVGTSGTVTTNAEGTIFNQFFGGGNGGTNLYRGQFIDSTPNDMPSESSWSGSTYGWSGFTPISSQGATATYDSSKGYHAEFEFEVFNQSNGLDTKAVARTYIHWAQFGITSTGNVTNILKDCSFKNNFYGGGNLANVSGNVTSTLTDCTVTGSAFGAGFSASIPSFPVHDKDRVTFPTRDAAGVCHNGKVEYLKDGEEIRQYTWCYKNPNTGVVSPAGVVIPSGVSTSKPAFQYDGKWYCYTTVSLENLGAVTGNVTLTIDGKTVAGEDGKVMTVGKSVYGGGEESAVNGTTTVSVTGGTIGTVGAGVDDGNVYGGGKGKKTDEKAGLVKGKTNVSISGSPVIKHNVYGGGAYGSVGTFTYNVTTGLPESWDATNDKGTCIVTITGGTIGTNGHENGMVFGSSRGDVGAPGGIEDKMAWVHKTQVTIGETTSESNATPLIKGSIYGGGENGHVFTDAKVDIHSGTIGITDTQIDGGAAYLYRGNVYGGGCGTDTYWIDANNNKVVDDGEEHYNPKAGIVQGNATITMTGGRVVHNVYGAGAMGSVGIANNDGTITNGLTTIAISGGVVGVDGKNGDGNVFGAARGDLSATGDNLAQVRETSVSLSSGTVQSCIYGGGEAGIVKANTTVTMSGGSVNHSVYGGGCEADVLGNTNVTMTDGYIFNGIFGGGLAGSVGTFTRSWAEADLTIFGPHASHEGCIGMPKSCAVNTGKCTIVVKGGQIGPIEVATKGMTRPASEGGPVPEGWVWGGGCGIIEDPATHSDTHFKTYVGSTDVTIEGNAFILESIIGGGEFGRVLGNTHVTIQGDCQIGVGEGQANGNEPIKYEEAQFVDPSITPITSNNALAECSHFPYGYNSDGDGKPEYLTFDPYYDQYYGNNVNVPEDFTLALGSTSLPSDGKTWIGCVFGGGSGYMPYEKDDGTGYGWIRSAGWVGGNTLVEIKGGHILTNVYGANEYSDVNGKSTVKMSGGTIGVPRTLEQIKANPLNGNLFGAGKGDPRTYFNTSTNVGSTEVEVTGGIIYGSVYGGGEDGHVLENAVTTIKKGEGKAPVIGCNGSAGNNGNVFGGGQGSATALTAGVVGGNITLNIENGSINGSVYGGGEIASVGTHFAMVKIEDPNNPGQMIDNPDYGKMQEGNDHGCIAVNLTGGTIEQNVYGGCMGTTENNALGVSKNVAVNLNGYETDTTPWTVADNTQGCVVKGSIFGCNNVNSSPEGTATVHVYKTQRAGQTRITNTESVTTAKVDGTQTNGEFDLSTFDVQAVYGGGNLAAYVPKAEDGSTRVIIDGCGRTSIGQVYGGGNAASTPATNVEVNGTYEIGELFGGGNGKDNLPDGSANPGANVGYKDYHLVENDPAFATKDARVNGDAFATYRYGTGEATVNIKGGTIHRVFGGSNTKGNVRKTALTMLEEVKENGDPICNLHIDEAYGGGKSALMDAEAKLLMACIPGLKEVYGGAQAADVNDDVTLTITNGMFDRVFGGNNISGTIRGKITVNIEETGCKPIIIGELYGGGNLAAYSVYGYDSFGNVLTSGSNQKDDPQINVKSFTSIGTVYGGGYGDGAVMVGSPHVNINVVHGENENYTDNSTYKNSSNEDVPYYDTNGFKELTKVIDGHEVTLPAHKKGTIGAINKVFGGGNAAQVIGDTYVNIGTETGNEINMVSVPVHDSNGKEPTDDGWVPTYQQMTVIGADIRGDVYGGGNEAEVTGNTNVTIGKQATTN